MILRFAKRFFPVLAVAVFFTGSVVQAQKNVVGVKVDSLQTESMRKFLKEHRQSLRQSKTDLARVVKEFREDFKVIKREQTRSLKVTRKYKPPVLLTRKASPKKKKTPRRSQSVTDSENSFPEQRIFESRKPAGQEKLLSLNERQRRADVETARREKILLAQNTDLGRLKAEMESDPLKSYQLKLTQFSEKIKSLFKELEGEGRVPRTVFLELGNTYLESQRYLTSLNAKDRWKLSRYASQSRTILGSYESVLWVFKMALTRKPNDAEMNFLLGKILSEMGERGLALRRA